MDSLDWELNQLCRKMETKRRKAKEEQQEFHALSPELQMGHRGSGRELERIYSIPLESFTEKELKKVVGLVLNMPIQDIVGTEGARGLLKIRKYCADDLILERLLKAFEEMFAHHELDDR